MREIEDLSLSLGPLSGDPTGASWSPLRGSSLGDALR
ncbi:TPA_asm: hypothetical protein, partial [ssRNA phage Gephyllon.1_3]